MQEISTPTTNPSIGSKIRIVALPPYLKTADPMPMLRPANLIQMGEEGIITDYRPQNYWAIRLSKGTFLIEHQYFEVRES
jgi:hypothetical protein